MANYGGKGTQLHITINTSFVPLSQAVEITGPSGEMGTREVTHLDSSAREFAPTILDGGEFTWNMLYDANSASQSYFQSKVYTATPATTGETMKLVLSTTTKTIPFNGIPTRFNLTGMNVDGTVTAECAAKVTGLPTMPTTT